MKKYLLFLFLSLWGLIFPANVSASEEFSVSLDTTYTIRENGITHVNNKFDLTNNLSNLYATTYSIILDSSHITNVKSFDVNGTLPQNVSNSDSKTIIKVNFNDKLVGKGNSRQFWISYDETGLAVKTGEIWEITLPKLSENSDFSNFNLTLEVPESFGQEAYMSPNPSSTNTVNGYRKYFFNKNDLIKTGVVSGFGEFQVFTFTLKYHLENPLNKQASTTISLPPDTAFQRLYYTEVSPRPKSIEMDNDGNWIATYELGPRQRIDVTANGSVQIFATQRPFLTPSDGVLQSNLKRDEFWQTDDPKIIELASRLKTPYEIYNYVANHLKYNTARVTPTVSRYGAVKANDNPSDAICMEYTDLFIAIARAAGIPSREVNGFAYTENPEIQPLSLVNDVLHAWPEYYDFSKKAWIPIDPTWASTTGGVDFFNKLDLRHFTFVIHGNDSKFPYPAGSYKLGDNPQKDIYVSFGQLPKERNTKLDISYKLTGWFPLLPNRITYTVKNDGPVALYDVKPVITFDYKSVDSDDKFQFLAPFSQSDKYVDIPFSFLATKTPDVVGISVLNKDITIKTAKRDILIYNLLFVFIIVTVIILSLMFRLKKWNITSIFKKKN